MDKGIKTGNETRAKKDPAAVINDNSEARKAAAEAQQAELEARAEAVGLEKTATLDEVIAAEVKAAAEAAKTEEARQKELKTKNPKLWALQNTVNSAFADRATTNLPRLTETDVKNLLGKQGASVKVDFTYSDDKKSKGFIEITEFDDKVRCPLTGEFDFGFDYAAAAKETTNQAKEVSK